MARVDLVVGGRVVPARALTVRYSRAGGPGGQNVNKVETKVEVRLRLADAGLPPAAEARLRFLAGDRVTAGGDLRVVASENRERERNVEAAWARLSALLRAALTPPRPRVPTRPTRGSRKERIRRKERRARLKESRKAVGGEEEG